MLREGATVGVVDVTEGSEERIVELMLGDDRRGPGGRATAGARRRKRPPTPAAPCAPASLRAGTKLADVSFDLYPGEVLGSSRSRARARTSCSTSWPAPSGRAAAELLVDGAPVVVPPPGRCDPRGPRLRAGRPRRGAADAAFGPREHRPAVHRAAPVWGPIDLGRERRKVNGAIERLQIDTRAASEVRRLSGGNQQKVTIARWVAGGVRTLLCFDPTRGIDIGTKHQIYQLLRDLAEAGAAVLLYTSELKEIQLACDRAIVIFRGRVVAEIPVEDADEPTLLRAAYDLRPTRRCPRRSPRPSRAAASEPSTAEADG